MSGHDAMEACLRSTYSHERYWGATQGRAVLVASQLAAMPEVQALPTITLLLLDQGEYDCITTIRLNDLAVCLISRPCKVPTVTVGRPSMRLCSSQLSSEGRAQALVRAHWHSLATCMIEHPSSSNIHLCYRIQRAFGRLDDTAYTSTWQEADVLLHMRELASRKTLPTNQIMEACRIPAEPCDCCSAIENKRSRCIQCTA